MKHSMILLAALALMAFAPRSNDSVLIQRIKTCQNAGVPDGAPYSIALRHRIDDTDFLLIGSENGAALEDHPELPRDQVVFGEWYDIMPGSKASVRQYPRAVSYNGVVESAFIETVRPQFRLTPEEILWQMRRVQQLKDEGYSLQDRIRIMTQERKSKPWK